MGEIFFPIIGKIDSGKKVLLQGVLGSIGGNDNLICYISSKGGETNIASYFVEKITELSARTIVYGGENVSSAAVIIFSSFQERFAFHDSKFLIHPCIPPKGMDRIEIFDQFDQEVWQFMSKRMKISVKDLEIIAKQAKSISSREALEIGLVQEVIKTSYKQDYKKKFSKTMVSMS